MIRMIINIDTKMHNNKLFNNSFSVPSYMIRMNTRVIFFAQLQVLFSDVLNVINLNLDFLLKTY